MKTSHNASKCYIAARSACQCVRAHVWLQERGFVRRMKRRVQEYGGSDVFGFVKHVPKTFTRGHLQTL